MVEKVDIGDNDDDEESAETNKPISLDFQVYGRRLKMFFPFCKCSKEHMYVFAMLGHNNLNLWAIYQEAPRDLQ